MKPISSTAEILAYKILNRSVDKTWINWAVDMLMAGFDTEYLTILAGASPLDNQFEMRALTDKVLDELQLDYSDKSVVFRNYASFLVSQCLAGKRDYFSVLGILRNIFWDLNYDENLSGFHLLCYAKEDLLTSEAQWYWYGADRTNIDAIIRDYFTKWLVEHPVGYVGH